MKSSIKRKAAGFYLLLLAGICAIAATAYYVHWGLTNYTLNPAVVIGLGLGLGVNIGLLLWDNDYLVIALTALYSAALFQLLVDSAGSFADAYQGIVMFGDPTQVGAIVTMGSIIAASIIASVISGFMKRVKAE